MIYLKERLSNLLSVCLMNTKMNVVCRLTGIITLATKNKLQILKQNNYMTRDLKKRIKYQVKNNYIIFSTLGLTIAPNNN